jgi:pimeloyl-ACP methyl ester carboxylesterase
VTEPRNETPAVRRVRRILLWTAAALLVLVTGFLAYASIPMSPESGPLAKVTGDPRVGYSQTSDGVVLTPLGTAADPVDQQPLAGTGLVFLAGARVDPAAYAYKLSGLVDAGMTVVIARPLLNFAILENRSLTTFQGLAPGVKFWYVGGHSLGGVRACQYAKDDATVQGLILFGSYCAADLSDTYLPVLSISGARDGLSTPEKIRDNAHLLPATTDFVQIPGANHANFGDYGAQPGDNSGTASDVSVRRQITAAVLGVLGQTAQ